jgi:hypothetical protein
MEYKFSIGASTAIFGIMALFMVYIYDTWHILGPRRTGTVTRFTILMALNIITTFSDKNIGKIFM